MLQIIQITFILFIPYLSIRISDHYKNFSFLSPIVICFAAGILLRNLQLMPVDEQISGIFRDASILVALPLLLFSSDVKAWIKHSRQTIFSFGLAVFAGLVAVILASSIFKNSINDIWIPAGMIGGIHTGGTPNLFAVGLALGARDEVITLTNSAQILWGGINLLFLLSFSQKVFGYFLKPYNHDALSATEEPSDYLRYDLMSLKDILYSLVLVIIIVGLSIGLSFLIFSRIEPTLIIVLVTTAAILSSFSKKNQEA